MATAGDDLIFFDGVVGQLTTTLVNPYSGETVSVDEQKNINRSVYDGLGGVDTILMTNLGDVIFIRDTFGNQVVRSVETFLAGDGGDIVFLADANFIYNSVNIFGGAGDDILWSNDGDDFISASSGNDHVHGGAGNDIIFGEGDNDYINGGAGNDQINGGIGNDTLIGGDGADTFTAGQGNDLISEGPDGDLDIIMLGAGITLASLTFSDLGDDLFITVGALGTITIDNQFASSQHGIDKIQFADGSFFDLRSLPHNYSPVANDDSFVTDEDTALVGNVLDNDTDQNNDALSVVAGIFTTAHGTIELLADGSFTYTPDLYYFGNDSFDYTVLDGQGGSDAGHVSIIVNSINDAPVAQDDDLVVDEDGVVSGKVLANDSDIDGGILSVIAATLTTIHGGSVVILADGSFTYTSALNYNGTDSFDYALLDGQGGSDAGTVNIVVNSINDDPVATDDNYVVDEDNTVAGNVFGNDSDIDGGVLSVIAATFTTVNGGTVELFEDGSFTYAPDVDFFGSDSFDYTLLDGQGGQDVGTVNIVVNSINDEPVAADDDVSGDEDEIISGNVLLENGHGLDSDVDGGILSVVAAIFTTVNGGSVEILADGSFTYTPATDYSGSDSFDYTLLDGQGGSDIGTVNITVGSVNDGPVAQDDDIVTDEDTAVSGNVLGNDSDSDGGILSVIAATITTVHNGTVVLMANGSFTYTPSLNFFGADSFDYTLLDGQGGSDVGTVNITINSINDGPVAANDAFTGNEDAAITGNLLINDSDVDGGILSVTAGTYATAHGSVTVLANGDFTYTPNADYFGSDSFSYNLLDGQGGSAVGNVSLVLNAVNDGIVGTSGDDILHGTVNDDHIDGLGGNDIIYGHMGNDYIVGGDGKDFLYGGSNTASIVLDKDFHDPIMFPNVEEGTNIKCLKPPGTPALGIYEDNLTVDYDASATITFRKGFAGYDNTFGMYKIAADGTIEAAQVLWANVKTAGVDIAHTIDLPVGADGGRYAFFIIADGNNVNSGYNHLDITGEGNIHFIYKYGQAGERAATINDAANKISIVYDDGVTRKVLQGDDYHTTERGDSTAINHDNKVHVISGMVDDDNSDVLRIGFEDLPFLGDADYEDVLFDLDINEKHIDVSEQDNDVLIGGAGDDRLYGEGGDDILVVGLGADRIYGGAGRDQIVYDVADNKQDTIYGFETGAGGDVLNLTDVLDGYDALTDAISDFVRLVQHTSSGTTKIQINEDGHGNDFHTIGIFDAIINDSVATLVANGNLVLDQSVIV